MKQYETNKQVNIDLNGENVVLTEKEIKLERYEQKIIEEKYTPNVIEPSFGIGRIVYCVMEHCFGVRKEDKKRTYFNFPPAVAPVKVSVLPLIGNEEMLKYVEPIRKILVQNGISYKVDDVNDSIGRRYARTDEIGIPFGITIDDVTSKDETVTFRELMSMKQIRVPIKDIGDICRNLSNKIETWEDIVKRYPLFEAKKEEK
jgi:glycyl-tRNA synthetase